MQDNNPEGRISIESTRAATVETYGVRRRVRMVAILENELDTLTALTIQTSTWLAVALALASLAAGIWVSACFTDRLTAEGRILVYFAAPLMVVLALVCGGLSLVSWWKRRNALKRIFDESLTE